MIVCKEAVERLWSYLDRNIERAEEDKLEQHLGLCRHCCGELEFARQLRAKLATSEETADPSTRERLRGFLRSVRG